MKKTKNPSIKNVWRNTMIKKKIITNCLTRGVDIQHKHKGAKYCSSNCYWTSNDSELKSKQRIAAKNGMIKHNYENGVWNLGLTKDIDERLKHISESRMGGDNPYTKSIKFGKTTVYNKGKTLEEVHGIKKAKKIRDKLRKATINQYINGNTKNTNTKPERDFKKILETENVEYIQSFDLENKIYDFFLPNYNILIEIDGIYWHGKGISDDMLNETQLKNRKNDKLKNKIAKNNNYKLIRIWGDELENFNLKNTLNKN